MNCQLGLLYCYAVSHVIIYAVCPQCWAEFIEIKLCYVHSWVSFIHTQIQSVIFSSEQVDSSLSKNQALIS